MSCVDIRIDPSAFIIGATYNSQIDVHAGTRAFRGNYTFNGPFNADTLYGNSTFNNAQYNPSFDFRGGIHFAEAGGNTITWTKGSGTITFSGSGSQNVNFPASSLEPLVIAKSGSGTVTFTGTGTMAGLDIRSGNVNFNGKALTVTGNMSIGTGATVQTSGLPGTALNVGGNLSLLGTALRPLNLSATGSWTVQVTGSSALARYVSVAHSDATGGTQISCANHCTNDGSNINWAFPVSGYLYDADGVTPIAGAPVSLSANGEPIGTQTTKTDGSFSINTTGFHAADVLAFAATSSVHAGRVLLMGGTR